MTNYVCGFMKDSRDRIALVRKNKPTWQAGKLNGIGGGIEDAETPMQAMRREWYEETTTHYSGWQKFAELRFADSSVHFFKAEVRNLPDFPPLNDIGERIEVWDYSIVVRNAGMIPNLKWLLPLAFEDNGAGVVMMGKPLTATQVAANDNECFTLPNGDCIAPNCCLHSVAA